MVEGEAESLVDVRLYGVLLVAISTRILAGSRRADLGRRAVFVRAADEKDLGARLAAEACVHICRQQRADEVAEVLDAVDVRNGAGDEIAGHGSYPSGRTPNPEKSKSPPARAEELGFGLSFGRALNPPGHHPCGWARAFAERRSQLFCSYSENNNSPIENQSDE